MSSFEDKSALVTGAGSGIGEACAKRLASLGAKVMVSDIDHGAGERVVAEIERAGGVAELMVADVTVADDVSALVDACVRRFGALDLAVNNAGIACPPTPFHLMDLASWKRVLDVDLWGVMLCMRAELAHFVDRGSGAIVNIASVAGLRAGRGSAPYCSAKHAVVGMTRSAALDYASMGIRVNAVAPGPIATPAMAAHPEELRRRWSAPVPAQRLGEPSEIAAAVTFLLSDDAAFITGTVQVVDGGLYEAGNALPEGY